MRWIIFISALIFLSIIVNGQDSCDCSQEYNRCQKEYDECVSYRLPSTNDPCEQDYDNCIDSVRQSCTCASQSNLVNIIGKFLPATECPECNDLAQQLKDKAKEVQKLQEELNTLKRQQIKTWAEAKGTLDEIKKARKALNDFINPKPWGQINGKEFTSADQQVANEAKKNAYDKYKKGKISAKELENYWKTLSDEEIHQLKEKKQKELEKKADELEANLRNLNEKAIETERQTQSLEQKIGKLNQEIKKLQEEYEKCKEKCKPCPYPTVSRAKCNEHCTGRGSMCIETTSGCYRCDRPLIELPSLMMNPFSLIFDIFVKPLLPPQFIAVEPVHIFEETAEPKIQLPCSRLQNTKAYDDEADCKSRCTGKCNEASYNDLTDMELFGGMMLPKLKPGLFGELKCWTCQPIPLTPLTPAIPEFPPITLPQFNEPETPSIIDEIGGINCPEGQTNYKSCHDFCKTQPGMYCRPSKEKCYACVKEKSECPDPEALDKESCEKFCPQVKGAGCDPIDPEPHFCYKCHYGPATRLAHEEFTITPPRPPEQAPKTCKELKETWETETPAIKQQIYQTEQECTSQCFTPLVCKQREFSYSASTPNIPCWSCTTPECEDLRTDVGNLFSTASSCRKACRGGYCRGPHLLELPTGDRLECFLCQKLAIVPEIQRQPMTPPTNPPLPMMEPTIPKTGEELSCSCPAGMTNSLPNPQNILNQLNAYQCVSGARIRLPSSTIQGCPPCYGEAEVNVDQTPPICQSQCGSVSCGQSTTCACPDKPNCELHVSCNWGGWRSLSPTQYVPIIGS